MQKFIGEKLEKVLIAISDMGLKHQIVDNNFSVDGDTKLVTNIKMENKVAIITTGNFVFDVKNKQEKAWNKEF